MSNVQFCVLFTLNARLMMHISINVRGITSQFIQLMLIQQREQPKGPLPVLPPISIAYTSIKQSLNHHQYFSLLSKQEHQKIKQSGPITLKMRTKLFNWLQKLALSTFKFSKQTLLLSGLLIDQYLQNIEETPNKLQLVGCAALFVASKLKEQTIVDPDCYVTASCNIFSRKQLIQKQALLYTTVDWKKINKGIFNALRKALSILDFIGTETRCLQLIWNCLKDEEMNQWGESKILFMTLAMVSVDTLHKIEIHNAMTLMKQL